MKLVQKFTYTPLTREDGGPNGRMYIDPTGDKLPSVTTILDRTKSDETKRALEQWKRRMGAKKAEDIKNEAAFRGTLMHGYLERHLKGENPQAGTNYYHKQGYKMAGVILETFLQPFLDEFWALECALYYPGLYAGTSDMIGVYQGQESIIDFKQTNKLKTDDRINDYKVQLAAYLSAHNKIHGTNIKQGVILMCSKDLEPQSWVIRGNEMEQAINEWWTRVAKYHAVG
jgi:hypothetical protein